MTWATTTTAHISTGLCIALYLVYVVEHLPHHVSDTRERTLAGHTVHLPLSFGYSHNLKHLPAAAWPQSSSMCIAQDIYMLLFWSRSGYVRFCCLFWSMLLLHAWHLCFQSRSGYGVHDWPSITLDLDGSLHVCEWQPLRYAMLDAPSWHT
jgi:hypothetical protein